MAAYADYPYYTEGFGGAAIPEEKFDSCALRASRQLDMICMGRIAGSPWADSAQVKDAACAAAELIYRDGLRQAEVGFMSSQTTGRVSITYQEAEPLEAQIYAAIQGYLFPTGLLFRGCGCDHQHGCHPL